MNTYIPIISLVHKFCHITVRHETYQRERERDREREHKTQMKQRAQYNMNKQMSVLQSPKSSTVHNIIYLFGFSNHSLSN